MRHLFVLTFILLVGLIILFVRNMATWGVEVVGGRMIKAAVKDFKSGDISLDKAVDDIMAFTKNPIFTADKLGITVEQVKKSYRPKGK